MKKKPLNQTIDDLVRYLYYIKDIAKPLDKDQKEELTNMIRTILIFLICMKKITSLGGVSGTFFDKEK